MQPASASSSPASAPSLLTPLGYQSNSCGYCKADESSASYYVRAKTLCPSHYQELMDRGWRRSGNLMYLPDPSRSCCQHYTIRLPVSDFKPTRDQRQALHRWNRYVLGGKYIQEASLRFPKSKAEKKRLNNDFDLAATVHESETSYLKPGIEPEHKFEVTLESDSFTKEKFAVFDNYQRHVHHEGDGDITEGGFRRFLCSSSITRQTDGNGKKLGSYHQCYRLDGRLIAMAVLDLLPHAVSGVYFVYHSDVERWSFGKLSALREAALALEESYQYYYMGYYIHSCKKMRYKGDYRPQFVLDCHSLQWDALDDEMRTLMDRGKYASMSKERQRREKNPATGGEEDASDDTPILYPLPLDAMRSGLSLLNLGMPGVLTPSELRDQIDLDSMRVALPRSRGGSVHEMRTIQSWSTGSETDPRTFKGIFAELAAALGPNIARDAVVDFN